MLTLPFNGQTSIGTKDVHICIYRCLGAPPAADHNAARRKGNWGGTPPQDRLGVWQVDRLAAHRRRQTLEEIRGSAEMQLQRYPHRRKFVSAFSGTSLPYLRRIRVLQTSPLSRRDQERRARQCVLRTAGSNPETEEELKRVTLQERFRYNRSRWNQTTTGRLSLEPS